jgi:hypothetical protein
MDSQQGGISMESDYAELAVVDDYTPIFYVGHHESKRQLPISDLTLRRAQDVGVSYSASLHSLLRY